MLSFSVAHDTFLSVNHFYTFRRKRWRWGAYADVVCCVCVLVVSVQGAIFWYC